VRNRRALHDRSVSRCSRVFPVLNSLIPSALLPTYLSAAGRCEGLDWTVLAAIHRLETNFGTGKATSAKGAQGPMQFMPTTFGTYGVDGNGDGAADINDVTDAVFSAANMLCANGAGDPSQLAKAIWNYNHSGVYVAHVLALANSYGVVTVAAGVAGASPAELLANRRVTITANAQGDVENGLVDPRLLTLLEALSRTHTLTVTVFKTGHSMRTTSGSISNHYYGRAADISVVDGVPVSSSNVAARGLVLELVALKGPLRPTEVGHPFSDIRFSGGFTDSDHRNHVHVGYE
jgi:hypothetical protein